MDILIDIGLLQEVTDLIILGCCFIIKMEHLILTEVDDEHIIKFVALRDIKE